MADFKAFKGILFDLDETLLDSLNVYWEAFNRGTSDFGLKPVEKSAIARFLDEGLRLDQMLLTLSPQIFTVEANRLAIQENIRLWYRETGTSKVKLKPGARRLLQLLKRRDCRIGIVTGRMGRGENKWTELRRLGIADFITSMVTAAEAAPKPAPDGLLKCADELGLAVGDCLFVGDSRIDISAGKNARMKTAAISGGAAPEDELHALQPDYFFDNLDSLRLFISGPAAGNKKEKSAAVSFQGVAVQGLGESSCFTCLGWVKEQLISKLGIDPFPGTFNLEVRDPSALRAFGRLKKWKGIEIVPGQPGYCPAKAFPVRLNGVVDGALIIPLVPGYPPDKVEIIAAVNLRQTLSVKDGDLVEIEALSSSSVLTI
jgi:HAD superfamily hydrolase (TIGR01509 family)